MNAVRMRPATPADLPAIVALLADDVNGAGREDASPPLNAGYLAAFEAIATDPNQELIVAEQDGRIIGTLQLSYLPGLSFKGAWRGQIEAVRIASDLRGRGLGGQLIHWAVERCRTRNCRMVQLTSKLTRADAHRFYEKRGWEKSHAGFKFHFDGEQ
ncbi:MAG: GNAT family N-acetyltransferase [Candidatus Sphingomonas colombiensis]|nr:GNAT family N-acetyltransferase [Sphingomonas sp.]WEK44171.1 MAG: GNAT family N-acetyltransferase [Sphingomonas sp.]